MLSPTPTQQKPEPQEPEKRVVKATPSRRRTGQTPLARFVKAILRFPIKGLYYILTGVRTHKLVTLGILLLLAISVSLTNFVATGAFPFGIGNDPFNFHLHGTTGGGDQVKNWLYALRDGDATTMTLLDKFISQPPDPNQLITSYSEKKAHLSWKTINVVGVYSEPDTTVDSFVEVDLSATGPGGPVSGILLWHFTTANLTSGPAILNVHLVDFRAPLL